MPTASTRRSSKDSFTIIPIPSSGKGPPEAIQMPSPNIPHLRPTINSAQLIVKGEPFLILGGELHNSSLSSAVYMRDIWQNMKNMNINTLLGAVTWEMIEPVEGQFSFTQLDKVILDARQYGMHLVLLWFGSFKNAMSTYAPSWVKKDVIRFPRVRVLDEDRRLKTIDLVSPFNSRAWEADASAFAALMRHLKRFDEAHSTVLMVQGENECGLLGDSRDRSKVADEAFAQPVPTDLMEHLKSTRWLHPTFCDESAELSMTPTVNGRGTWEMVFGEGIRAEEMFMAHAFSRYVGHVATAGKKQYPIPLYTNVWLNYDNTSVLDLEGVPKNLGLPSVVGGGSKPGIYPSGGPCPNTLDIWKYNAPALDFIAPDIYLHNYDWACKQYRFQNQPLFIPEQRADKRGARRVWLAYGTYGCIGCSPFGIDTIEAKDSAYTQQYRLLASISKYVLNAQAERPEEVFGFFFDEVEDGTKPDDSWSKTIGAFEVVVKRSFVFGTPSPGCGMIIHRGDGRFLLIGSGFEVTFKSTKPRMTFTGVLNAWEKTMDAEGKLYNLRSLNGDERRGGSVVVMPSEDPDYGGFPIRVTIPARTYIAECTAYSVEETEDNC